MNPDQMPTTGSLTRKLDGEEAEAQAAMIKKAVAALAAGAFDPEQINAFLAARPNFVELIKEGHLRGLGLKKALKELVDLLTTLVERPTDEIVRSATSGSALRVRFF